MVHLWVRSESRANEQRVGIMPGGVAALIAQGFRVTVEESPHRIVPIADYAAAGADIAAQDSWPQASRDVFVFGLKELPDDGTALPHRHIMFGHAYRGQSTGPALLSRFRAGGGALYDLEYLVDGAGRRLAAFGYWAGFAGAAVSLQAWAAQKHGLECGPVHARASQDMLKSDLRAMLDATGAPRPRAIIVGALGRVGTGAGDLLADMGVSVTKWDMAETASGGPYPEILAHDLFINCITAGPKTPVLLPRTAVDSMRALTVVGDVACDPKSDFNPIPLYDHPTDWTHPTLRVADAPPLDIMAIDNLPSLLPHESSVDFATQLLPVLKGLDHPADGPWARAAQIFHEHAARL